MPGASQAVGQILKAAQESGINLGYRMDNTIHVALDETVDRQDILTLVTVFAAGATVKAAALDESVERARRRRIRPALRERRLS